MELREFNIVNLLKTFPKNELDRISKFISSPYFNTNKNIATFFSELSKYYPTFENKNFTKEKIYSAVFPKKLYNDSNFRWIISEISKLIEKYLIQKTFEDDLLIKDNYLFKEHLNNQRKDLSERALKLAEKNLSEFKHKDYMYFFYKYLNYTNRMSHKMIYKNDKKMPDLDFLYENFLKALISYINHSIIGITYDYLNADILFTKYHRNGIAKKINDIIKILNFTKVAEYIKNDNDDADILEGAILMLNVYLNIEDDTHYEKFKNFTYTRKNKDSKASLENYFSKLISYCRLKIINNINENYYQKELFFLSQEFIENKYYNSGNLNTLSPVLYRIFLENALETGKFSFAEKLVENETGNILNEHREDAINYGRSLLQFYKENYDISLELLSKVNSNFFVINQKALRIILFIEKEFFYESSIEIKSFKKYLLTNKFLSNDLKEMWNGFAQVASFFTEKNSTYDKGEKKRFLDLLESQRHIYFKKWFVKKINRS